MGCGEKQKHGSDKSCRFPSLVFVYVEEKVGEGGKDRERGRRERGK